MSGPASVYAPRAPDPGTARLPPGFFESIRLGYRQAAAGPDYGLNQTVYEGNALAEVEQELRKRGWNPPAMLPDDRSTGGLQRKLHIIDVFAELERQRARDPRLLPQYAGIRDSDDLSAWAAEERRRVLEDTSARLEEGSTAGQLVGALGRGLTDPTSYIPVSGQVARGAGFARQVLTVAGREAAANVGTTIALELAVQGDAARIGVDRDAGDFASDVAMSAVTGGVIGGGGKGLEIGVGKLIGSKEAADAFRERVPEENWTPDERAAVNVLERDEAIAAASPLAEGEASVKAHAQRLDEAMAQIVQDRPPPKPTRVTRGALLSGTADPGLFRFPPRAQLKARIRGVESGGADNAVNPRSTASGRYQFTMPTWLSYYKRRYGAGKQSNAEIWAKRFDPALQEVLMDDLIADNARMLREADQPETAGSLYLLHFAGPDGLKVLRSAPDVPVARLLSADAIARNPFLEDMTAGDMIAWADRKMGSATAPRFDPENAAALPDLPEGAREPVLTADFEARPDWMRAADAPILRAELFGTPEEHARAQVALWREWDRADGFAELVDDPPPPGPSVTVPPPRPRRETANPHVMQAIAEAGGIRDNEGHDLVGGRNIPKFQLGAGAIIRDSGRSIDEMGERLWELGFFGPPETAPRPTEAQVLDLIESARERKVYTPEETARRQEMAQARLAAAEEEDVRFELASTAQERFGVDLDEATLDDALLRRARGETIDDSVEQAIEAAAMRELPEEAGPAPEAPGFTEPTGPEAGAQAASIEHDLRMDMEAEAGGSFRLDEEGEEVSLGALIDSLDDEIAAAETMRGCMAPAKVAAE